MSTYDNGAIETPDWSLPKPTATAETLTIPANIVLGSE